MNHTETIEQIRQTDFSLFTPSDIVMLFSVDIASLLEEAESSAEVLAVVQRAIACAVDQLNNRTTETDVMAAVAAVRRAMIGSETIVLRMAMDAAAASTNATTLSILQDAITGAFEAIESHAEHIDSDAYKGLIDTIDHANDCVGECIDALEWKRGD